jgi:hypothetical protein
MLASGSQRLRLGEKTGYEKRKKVYYSNHAESTFFDDAHRSHFFYFCQIK